MRKHVLAHAAATQCDIETAALRVFSNADGAYGSNVNQLIEESCWEDEDELADVFTQRTSFASGVAGKPVQQPEIMTSVLGQVEVAYQNLESVELAITTVEH